MSKTKIDKTKYYQVNQDYTGIRQVRNEQELVEYRSQSMHRIWLNDLDSGYDMHWHIPMEIIVPIEDTYSVNVGGEIYNLVPDDILFIPPREPHQILTPNGGMRFIYILNISMISKLRSFAGIQPILSQPLLINPHTHPAIYNDIYDYLVQIRSEYFNENEFSELRIQSLLLNIFVRIGENRTHENEMLNNIRSGKQHEYVQRFNTALQYIDANYTEDISLDNLADKIGFSKYHFSRLFKQYTDYNFSDYLCIRRIKAAEELLGNPQLSITDVALGSGFASISTFNRIFKQKKGITPTEYRKLNQFNQPLPS